MNTSNSPTWFKDLTTPGRDNDVPEETEIKTKVMNAGTRALWIMLKSDYFRRRREREE